jgi:hypothetical protein
MNKAEFEAFTFDTARINSGDATYESGTTLPIPFTVETRLDVWSGETVPTISIVEMRFEESI